MINGSARDLNNTEVAIKDLCPFDKYTVLDLRHLHIGHYRYGQVHSDDFLNIAESMTKVTSIVFATPVYWYAMSGLMKVFLDRFTELITTQKVMGRKLIGKKVYLIAQGTDPELPPGFEVPFEKTASYFGMNFVGKYYMSIKG